MEEFRNEPYADFSVPANRQAMEAALAQVRAQFGHEYDLEIAGEHFTKHHRHVAGRAGGERGERRPGLRRRAGLRRDPPELDGGGAGPRRPGPADRAADRPHHRQPGTDRRSVRGRLSDAGGERRSTRADAGLREGAQHQAVPAGDDFLVAMGPDASRPGGREPVPHRIQNGRRLRRHRVQNVPAIEISGLRYIERARHRGGVGAERDLQLGGRPGVEAAFLTLAVGVEARKEAALG